MLGKVVGNCLDELPYTGIGSCPKQEGKTVALLITPRNATFPVDAKEFITQLGKDVVALPANRVFPVKNIIGMTINGGDINAPEMGTYGGTAPTNLNAKNIAYQIDGGDCLYKELAKFNKRKMRVFRVDDEGFVYGTVTKEGDATKFVGFECTLYANRVPTDGSTAYNLTLNVYYTPNLENEEKNMHAFQADLPAIPDGLIGLTLVKGSAANKAKVVTACGGEDVTDEFGESWDATCFLTSAGAAPTSATYENGEITFVGGEGGVRVAGADKLNTAGIVGFEGIPEIVSLT